MRICDACGKPAVNPNVIVMLENPSGNYSNKSTSDTYTLELCGDCRVGFVDFIKKITDPKEQMATIGFDRRPKKEEKKE